MNFMLDNLIVHLLLEIINYKKSMSKRIGNSLLKFKKKKKRFSTQNVLT